MSLKTVRKSLKELLEQDEDLQNMFDTFLIEKRPTPNQLDAITIRKLNSEEADEEFGSNYKTKAIYTFEIVATMKRSNIDEGDEAQILADQYIREAIKSDIDLDGTIAFMRIGRTAWGIDVELNDLYYTVVPMDCIINETPTDRN